MWYEILINNEYADYFINTDTSAAVCNDEVTTQMKKGLSDIIYGATMAWAFCDIRSPEEVNRLTKTMPQNILQSFVFCHSRLTSDNLNGLGKIYRSIPPLINDEDIESLSTEQCAVLLIHPFLHRMGYSDEEYYWESGSIKRYLCTLKNKCTAEQINNYSTHQA